MDNSTGDMNDRVETPGTMVRQAREARGMSLLDLSAATRIPRATLEHIEVDAFEELPAEVFIRGFLRNVARELRLNGQDVIDVYERYSGRVRTPVIDLPSVALAVSRRAETSPQTQAWRRRFQLPNFDHLVEFVGSARPAYVIGTLVVLLGVALAVSVVTSSLDRAPALTLTNLPPTSTSWSARGNGTKARWILDGQSNINNGVVTGDIHTDTKTTRAE
jgi:hypothetical protein